jgi:hypothetical protein
VNIGSQFPDLNGATALPALRSNMKSKIKIKPSHKGLLHRDLGVPQGEKIPAGRLEQALRSASPAVRKRANFAKAAKGWNKG